jgi:hypothetical protein
VRGYLLVLTVLVVGSSLSPAQVTDQTPLDRTQVLPGIHEELIGQDHCIKCHDATQRTSDAKCLECHKEIQAGLDRARGYHFNVVRNEGQSCETCHKEHLTEREKLTVWTDTTSMKAFDHEPTDYPLEGAHAQVGCRECHQPKFVQSPVSQRKVLEESFLGLSQTCAGCHEDVHTAKLGAECNRCHVMDNWNDLLPDAPFDHDRTDYALEGLHAEVKCEDCHRSGRTMDELPFGACTDCHEDTHQEQLTLRADGGRCDACHDLKGFTPALYDVAEHEESRYPLKGGHLAVGCNACHPNEMIGDRETIRLAFESTECEDCHTEYPTGHVTEISDRMSCKHCHTESAWSEMIYDHDQADYKLTGEHQRVTCAECHPVADVGTPQERVRYVDLNTECNACHEDIHLGQLAEKACEDCHTTESWEPTLFDHQKHSDYALDGKHLDVECNDCHRLKTSPEGRVFRHYKPMKTECLDCHGPDGSVRAVFAQAARPARSAGP